MCLCEKRLSVNFIRTHNNMRWAIPDNKMLHGLGDIGDKSFPEMIRYNSILPFAPRTEERHGKMICYYCKWHPWHYCYICCSKFIPARTDRAMLFYFLPSVPHETSNIQLTSIPIFFCHMIWILASIDLTKNYPLVFAYQQQVHDFCLTNAILCIHFKVEQHQSGRNSIRNVRNATQHEHWKCFRHHKRWPIKLIHTKTYVPNMAFISVDPYHWIVLEVEY